jgi:hypothetical protein
MRVLRSLVHAAAGAALSFVAFTADAADYPVPKEGTFVAKDFRFHTGEVLPEVRLHYRTIGEPSGEPVVVLHGTGGSGASMLTPDFAGELFGEGQPLDAAKYFIILPDAIGHGKQRHLHGLDEREVGRKNERVQPLNSRRNGETAPPVMVTCPLETPLRITPIRDRLPDRPHAAACPGS